MEHEIQSNFDCSRFTAISPLSKETIIEIAELLRNLIPESIACSDEPSLSLRFLRNESTYSLSEFRKNYSRNSDYTELGISIYSDRPIALFLIFHLSADTCFLNLRSNVLALAELEDLCSVGSQRIATALEHAQLTDVPEDVDHLETLYIKMMSLPVVDASGNVLNKTEKRDENRHNRGAKANTKDKTPWYKSSWFWGITGIAVTIVFGLITSFFFSH